MSKRDGSFCSHVYTFKSREQVSLWGTGLSTQQGLQQHGGQQQYRGQSTYGYPTGFIYKGCSIDATGAKGRLLQGPYSFSSRLRLVKSKQVVDKSRAESSVSEKSSTLMSLSVPDADSTTTGAARAEAATAAIFAGLEALTPCCTASLKLVSVCNHFWI